MKLKLLFLAAVLALPLASNPAQANPEAMGQRGLSDSFAAMDYNHDGKIDSDEFAKAHPDLRPEAFGAIDLNKDKVITREEWENFVKGHKKDLSMPPAEKGQMPKAKPKSKDKLGITPPAK